MKKLILFLLIVFLFGSCDNDNEDSLLIEYQFENAAYELLMVTNNDIFIEPSGDETGVTDANNIENALNYVKSYCGSVYLSKGDYFVSRNIVVEGFCGSLKGEGMDKSIIYAGRKSPDIGFEPAYSPIWTEVYGTLIPTVIQLDNAMGDVGISDLAILVNDEHPTNKMPPYWGGANEVTYILTLIEITGIEPNVNIESVRLEGKEFDNDEVGSRGMNVANGIHVMPWDISSGHPIPKKANLIVTDVRLKNIGANALQFMFFGQGSEINATNLQATNVGEGIYAISINDSNVIISNSNISVQKKGIRGITVWNVDAEMLIENNRFTGVSRYGVISLNQVKNAIIFKNMFSNIINSSCINILYNSSGITLENNDYKNSGVPGLSNGYGAIYLGANTHDNKVLDIKFPRINNENTLCDMIQDLGVNNEIINWESCVN